MCIKDMIIANSRGQEKGFLTESAQLDIDLGDTNDFELQMALSEYMNLGYQLGESDLPARHRIRRPDRR